MIKLSSFFALNKRDYINGIVVAVIAAVGGGVVEAAQNGTLDIFSYDWAGVLSLSWKVGVAYLVKNILTTKDGKVLGKI